MVSIFSYPFYYFIFAPTPTFLPSLWSSPSAVTPAICGYNHAYDKPVETLFLFLCSCAWYSEHYAYLWAAPLRDMDTDTEASNPPLPLLPVGHCQCFPAHYSWSCPPASLLHLPCCYTYLLLSLSSTDIIIRHLFCSPHSLACSVTSLLLTSWPLYTLASLSNIPVI